MTRDALATILWPIQSAGINAMTTAAALRAAILSGHRRAVP